MCDYLEVRINTIKSFFVTVFQGYLKVTVIVLGPGDEAPVSYNYVTKKC